MTGRGVKACLSEMPGVLAVAGVSDRHYGGAAD
jgi:hypothetical protein